MIGDSVQQFPRSIHAWQKDDRDGASRSHFEFLAKKRESSVALVQKSASFLPRFVMQTSEPKPR
jgi:hypothetical protein